MTPITPNGCGRISPAAGRNQRDTPARRGFIQRAPWRKASLTSSSVGQTSASSVSIAGRPPKSASIARAIAFSFSEIRRRNRCKRARRLGQSANGSRAAAARVAAKAWRRSKERSGRSISRSESSRANCAVSRVPTDLRFPCSCYSISSYSGNVRNSENSCCVLICSKMRAARS